jgi:hypothetical protein
MNLLPRRSDYTDARRNSNNNNNNIRSRQARGRTALDDILDAVNDDSSDDEEGPHPDMDWAENWIHRVNEGEGNQFRARLNSNMDDSVIREIMYKHGNGNSTGSILFLKKKLVMWSELPSYLYRKYFLCTNQQLKDRISELDGQAVIAEKNKDALLDLVVRCEQKRIGRNTT